MKRLRDANGRFISTNKFCKNKSCQNARLKMQKDFMNAINESDKYTMQKYITWTFMVLCFIEFLIIVGLTI